MIYCLLVQFVVIWYINYVLVRSDQEKSGNPGVARGQMLELYFVEKYQVNMWL
jgi:hypothetical protein